MGQPRAVGVVKRIQQWQEAGMKPVKCSLGEVRKALFEIAARHEVAHDIKLVAVRQPAAGRDNAWVLQGERLCRPRFRRVPRKPFHQHLPPAARFSCGPCRRPRCRRRHRLHVLELRQHSVRQDNHRYKEYTRCLTLPKRGYKKIGDFYYDRSRHYDRVPRDS